MRVIITDSHALFRDGVAIALDKACSDDLEVIHCNDFIQLKNSLNKTACDLMIVGSNTFPDTNPSTFKLLKQISGQSPIIVAVDEPVDVQTFKKSGLDGVIEKSAPLSSHVKLLELLTSSVKQANRHQNIAPFRPTKISKLTPKQREIWSLLARGLSNREISAELKLKEGTVKVHVTSILKRLGVRNRTEAMLLAHENSET